MKLTLDETVREMIEDELKDAYRRISELEHEWSRMKYQLEQLKQEVSRGTV